ncbi:MAG: SIS domain-containing protein [Chloroflexota bacterium]
MLENTFLYQEIHQQPEVITRLLEREKPTLQELSSEIRKRKPAFLFIAARGTSDNAARYANYLFGSFNRLPVALATPSLFSIYHSPPDLSRAFVLGVSQSGKSPDIVAVLEEGKRQGALTAAITNDPASELASNADIVIDLQAGAERSVAATKTYTAELAAIAGLSVTLAQDSQRWGLLQTVPDYIQRVLETQDDIQQIVPRYRYMRTCVAIGRGFNYCTAFELALKIKELTYTVVEPFSTADFLHGPIALITEGFPVFVIAPTGAMQQDMHRFLLEVRQMRAETLVISDDEALLQLARIQIPLPKGLPEWLSPLLSIVPGQLFAMYLAAERDLDPDHPRSLHKVTQTH